MAKTITANAPQSLQAFQIIGVSPIDPSTNQRQLLLSNGAHVQISLKQSQQFLPGINDYYVIPSEGHAYCAARSTFLQNYTVSS